MASRSPLDVVNLHPTVTAIDSCDGGVQQNVDTVLVGVPFEVVEHVIARREQRRAPRVWPAGQVGELSAGIELEPVVSRPPRGPDLIGAIDQNRPHATVL